MKIRITIETDSEGRERVALITQASTLLESFLASRSYGADIEQLIIGFIAVRPVKGFEAFSQAKKPRYTKMKKIELTTGDTLELNNTFSFDAKLTLDEYEIFAHGTVGAATNVICDALINSLTNFDYLPKKIKNFDADKFKLEFISQLHSYRNI